MAIANPSLLTARELLVAWTTRTIRARYQQSLLGWLWAIIQPAASVVIYTIVFTRIVRVDTGGIPYPVFSYVTVVPWTLLATALTDMTSSLVSNMNLVQKIYFPREVLPIAAMLARLMDFGIAALLLFVLMAAFGMPILPPTAVYLPLILATQLMLMIGLGLTFAAMNVFFRDMQSLLALGLQLWFYASPIIYPASLVPEAYRSLYFMNPMAGILQSYRDVLLLSAPPGHYLGYAALSSITIFLLGYWLFKRVESTFADII
jgi:lipopolysaccharide transport system permease protein